MKKILAIVGSPNDKKSNTITMIYDLLETVRQNNPDVEYEIISLGKYKIDYCHGCWAYMTTGCCMYKNDAFPLIRQKIKQCNLFMFIMFGMSHFNRLIIHINKFLFFNFKMFAPFFLEYNHTNFRNYTCKKFVYHPLLFILVKFESTFV